MRRRRGYLLLPVSLALALLAAVAFLLHQEGGLRRAQSAGRTQADAARALAEAGLGHMRWRLNRSNCTAYADLPSTSLGDGSYAVTVTPKAGTPVTLTATATLPDGTQARIVRRDVVVYGPAVTRSLQPNANGIDTYLDQGASTRNYGGDTFMWVSPGSGNTLLRWDLGLLPRVAAIRAAALRLNAVASPSGGGGPISVHRVTRDWVEGTQNGSGTADGATWTTYDGSGAWSAAGGDYEAAPIASRAVTSGGWQTWEVAPLVQEWVAGRIPNQGMLMKSDATTVKFASSDDASANRPTLDLVYALPCGMSAGPVTVTLAPAADTELDQYLPSVNWGGDVEMWLEKSSKEETPALRFDLQSIAPGHKVKNARLRLHAYAASVVSATQVQLEALTESWDEGTRVGGGAPDGATWNERRPGLAWSTPGGTTSGAVVASAAVAAGFAGGWLEFDLTAQVQQWVDFPAGNQGVSLHLTKKDNLLQIRTREAATNRPELVVTYE